MWYCYMLESIGGGRTYVGATVNPARRLRQHNGELAGGARATKGRAWTRRFLVGGFADERAALLPYLNQKQPMAVQVENQYVSIPLRT